MEHVLFFPENLLVYKVKIGIIMKSTHISFHYSLFRTIQDKQGPLIKSNQTKLVLE